jgi:peptidoglycan/LPS O-acetylase OafA/YrhL
MAEADQDPGRKRVPGRYFPALDGLRFFCCTAVIITHSFVDGAIQRSTAHPLLRLFLGDGDLGSAGVNVFFAISGFLITGLLLDEKAEYGAVSLPRFYMRRTLRIWPAYYATILVSYALLFGIGHRAQQATGFHPASDGWRYAMPPLFASNMVRSFQDTLIDPLWSLCVEEQFYLVFPVTFVFATRRWPAFLPALVALAIAWAARIHAASGGDDDAIYYNSITHGDHLLLGALVAQGVRAWPDAAARVARQLGTAGEVACVALILAGVAIFHHWPPQAAFMWWLSYASSATVGALLVFLLAHDAGAMSRLLRISALRRLGDLTYGCYVFHPYAVLAAWLACKHVPLGPWATAGVRTLLAIPLSFAIAYASRKWLEGPFLAMKGRFAATPRRATSSASTPESHARVQTQ